INVVSKLFHFIRLASEILCLEAIALSVSPDFTVYVEGEVEVFDDFSLVLLELSGVAVDLFAVSNVLFVKMASVVNSLMDFNCETLVSNFCAIFQSESPDFTLYVAASVSSAPIKADAMKAVAVTDIKIFLLANRNASLLGIYYFY